MVIGEYMQLILELIVC